MNIGDMVVVKRIPDSVYLGLNKDIKVGDIGIICNISEDKYGVDWGRRVKDGHSCRQTCMEGHGYFIDKRCISVAEHIETGFSFDEDDFKKYILMTGGAQK